jgi:pimeloyl-ACP methyl ester carboxylesterase
LTLDSERMIYERPDHGLRRAIGYDVRGEGPAVMFLHPFPFARDVWKDTRAALGDFRTIALDARGFGDSALGEPGFSIDELADDAVALLDHLGIAMAAIVGCSMGGYVALSMLARHPARASVLVLCDTRADGDGETARANRQAAITEIRAHGPSAYLEGVAVRLCGHSSSDAVRAAVEERALASSADFLRTLPAALTAMRDRPDRRALLPSLRLPTLVLCGAEDAVTPPDEARALQRAIPGATLELIDRAGHLPMLEQPDVFGERIRTFLTQELLHA